MMSVQPSTLPSPYLWGQTEITVPSARKPTVLKIPGRYRERCAPSRSHRARPCNCRPPLPRCRRFSAPGSGAGRRHGGQPAPVERR